VSFELSGVWFRYPAQTRYALRDVTAVFPARRHTAVVGPNGAGKSTLLRVLLGRLRCGRGEARFDGLASARWPRRDLARRVGVVQQEADSPVPLTVRELVCMGRHPYLRPWAGLGDLDHSIVDEALRLTDLLGLDARPISRLSGGELQRARVARALAQQPECLLLDEPTAHLDLAHEMEIFRLATQLVIQQSVTVITVTHNINLAARFADRLLLLRDGVVLGQGAVEHVFTASNLEEAFRWPIAVETVRSVGPQAMPLNGPPIHGDRG
jgi:iron complex transport system ATP-binding protein